MIPFVDLTAQYKAIEPEIERAIGAVLMSGHFILGPQVEEFERAFAQFIGVEHAVGVSSGLDALRLALTALEIGPGDEVILPANTYIATALAVSAVGATPVLVDCDPLTYGIDAGLIERTLTTRTKAVIPVHLAGQAANMAPIHEIGRRHGVHVIEDAAQAHGTRHMGRPCGSLGIIGCFSFYPAKNLGAYGDGGALTTNDSRLAERIRSLRNYGQRAKYEHVEQGLNARLDTLQAAILSVKLRYLAEWNERRRAHAAKYTQMLRPVGDLEFQQQACYSTHIYHLFMIETARRDALADHLRAGGVQTGIHYPVPIHLQEAYRKLGYKRNDFPCAERLAQKTLSLPMYAELSDEQILKVVGEIDRFFTHGKSASTEGILADGPG